jgi:hypothetical protein
MNRRKALTAMAGIAGTAGLSAGGSHAEETKVRVPGAIALKLGEQIRIGAQSAPVKVDDTDLHIVSIGTGTFQLDKESRLTARLNAAVAQYAKVVYWISAAVFDAQGLLLGTASHKESVSYTRLGAMPTTFRKIVLDFGLSKAFNRAALVVMAISERDVPKPG